MHELIKEKVDGGFSYAEYKTLVEKLLSEGKTTGPNQSEANIDYTKLGFQRLKKWEKITKVNPQAAAQLKELKGNYLWLVIIEAWCGDVGQNLAAIHLLAEAAHIPLKLVLRDENDDLMEHFLTNGGKSIPKLIVVDADTNLPVGTWGPRPATAQKIVLDGKAKDIDIHDIHLNVHSWYAKNKHEELQNEMLELMKSIDSKTL